MIGQKPEALEDPRRMEKNVINIQVNNMGQIMNLPLDVIRSLSQEDRELLASSMYEPVEDAQAEDIMNS